jgi:hypothetical protein
MLSKETIKASLEGTGTKLQSTHNKLCFPIILRIFKKMKMDIKFHGIKVDGNIIIDGYHRYVASLLAGIELEIHPSRLAPAKIIYDWKDVQLIDEEWDTAEKIKMLNEIDAEFNNIPLAELLEKLG